MKTGYDPKTFSHKFDYSSDIIPIDEIRKQVIAAIINDKETKITQCLIELGWTPPDNDPFAHNRTDDKFYSLKDKQ